MNKQTLWRNITYFVGGLAVIGSGMLFMVLGDLLLKATSSILLVLIIFSLGSTVCWFVSGFFKEEPKKCNLMKGIALGLALIFVILLFLYLYNMVFASAAASKGFLEAFSLTKANKVEAKVYNTVVVIITLVICAIGMVGQALNIFFCNKWKEE